MKGKIYASLGIDIPKAYAKTRHLLINIEAEEAKDKLKVLLWITAIAGLLLLLVL